MTDDAYPDVAVSIVNTSSRDLLLACLESLEPDAKRSSSLEVVVLDNASDDGSPDAVQERFPWVRLIAQPVRAGFGANHNTVIRATESRYVYVLNEDTTSEPGSIERLVAYMDEHPRVAAAGPRVVYPDGKRQVSAWRFPSPAVAALGALTLGRAGVVQSGGQEPRRVDWAMGCALLVRRAALDEIGLFDERFFIYAEETDLCKRLAAAGWETHYVPVVTVVHHVSQFTAGVPERRINEHWRSREKYWKKHHSPAGARAASLLTGWQYAVRAMATPLLLKLPEHSRPRSVRPEAEAEFRLNVRNAWHGVEGAGIAELADEWNASHQVTSVTGTAQSAGR